MVEYISDNPEFIVRGFVRSGILQLWMESASRRIQKKILVMMTMKRMII